MGKKHELAGQRFGKLLVVEQAPNQNGKTCWCCKCDCGNETIVCTHSLMKGKTSCGCDTFDKNRAYLESKREDLTGKRFGKLTVIKRDKNDIDKKGHIVPKWICKCDCGNEVSVKQINLKNHTKSCGCLQKETMTRISSKDMSGQKFGKLLVECKVEPYISPQGARLTRYLCQCECGNKKIVLGSHLKTGLTLSCGCYKKERTSETHSSDLTGQRFGFLTVIEKIGTEDRNNQKRILWRCLCDCGSEVTLNTNVLTQGRTSSCGCRRRYKGEEKIKEYLLDNEIAFERQKTYNDLKGVRGCALRYDFYLPESNLLIEYQGEQHYKVVQFSSSITEAEENYKCQKENDKIKKAYAQNHNINFLEIPYLEYENINEIIGNKLNTIS